MTPTPTPTSTDASQAQSVAFDFTGKGGEYFRIWIVNLFLSVITLGIYSAWAKVRNKRYFYGNTLLAGNSFDYLANPVTILKGRLIAWVVFLVYAIASNVAPIVAVVLSLVLLFATPTLVLRGISFNAKNSALRNVRFNFRGTVGEAVLVFVAAPLLMVFSLGLAYPFLVYKLRQFAARHTYGTSPFTFSARVREFYGVYLKAFGMVVAFGIVSSVIAAQMLQVSPATVAALMLPATQDVAATTEQSSSETETETENGNESMTADANVDAETEDDEVVASDSRSELAVEPDAESDSEWNDAAAQSADDADAEAQMAEANRQAQAAGAAAALALARSVAPFALTAMLMYVFVFAYLQAAVTNLAWNNTALDGQRFRSTLKTLPLAWLYISNMVAIILSFGMLIPWAKVRAVRYRMQNLSVTLIGDLDRYFADAQKKMASVGEEMADAFDIDTGGL